MTRERRYGPGFRPGDSFSGKCKACGAPRKARKEESEASQETIEANEKLRDAMDAWLPNSKGGKKWDRGKARYSLVEDKLRDWALDEQDNAYDYPSFPPAEAGTDRKTIATLEVCWGELCQRWGGKREFYQGVVRIMTHGAKEYGDHNWKLVEYERYYDAYGRHLEKGWYAKDFAEAIDPDSGEHHLLHAGANVLIMRGLCLELERKGKEED